MSFSGIIFIYHTQYSYIYFLGKIKESVSVPGTPDVTDGRFASVVDMAFSRSHLHRTKRENAAKLLWKTAQRRLSAKVNFL